MQYRATRLSSREMLSHTRELRRALGPEITLLMKDRSDLCLAAGFDGVHLGQNDASPTGARAVLGNRHWVGVSTHTVEQVRKANESEADYIGLLLAADAGYDPHEAVRVWERMQQSGGHQPHEFLSTHPGHETRIKRLTEEMPEALAHYEEANKAPVAQLPPIGNAAGFIPLAQQ